MEIVKSRYGVERSIERINLNKVRVLGESQFIRKSTNKNDDINMFDFEGGPCLNVGGKIKYFGTEFKIKSIKQEESKQEDLCSVLLEVSL